MTALSRAYRWAVAGLVLILSACSTTKHIPDDDQLFIGLTKIEYTDYEPGDHFDATVEEVEAALATKPNGALFGSSRYRTPFPYGLWIWNATEGSSGRFKQWLNKNFGKAPVLMSQVNPALRASVAQSVLRKNGYLHGDVTYTEVPQKNPKKMKIGYTVRLDSLLRIDTMSYERFPRHIMALIDSTRSEALLGKGTPFSAANLDAERTRVSQLLRNNGYYFYQPGYASFLADTFGVANRARLRLQMADSLPAEALRPWVMGNTTVVMRRSFMEQPSDTLKRRFTRVIHGGKRAPLRSRVIVNAMKLRYGRLFSFDDYMESVQKVNAIGVFQSVDFQFKPRLGDTLDLQLNCTLDKPYDFYVETNLINRTIGRVGPEVKVGVARRNAFRGGEKIDMNLHGSYEWQTNGQGSDMNSYQYGADLSVEFPRILFPRFSGNRNRRSGDARQSALADNPGDSIRPRRRRPPRYYSTPWTVAKVSSDVIRRPQYYKMHIVSGEWTYRWQPTETSRHELSPLTVKYQYMNSHTDRFDSLAWMNPYLIATMDDYFIPKMRYTYTYASPRTKRNPIRWETTVEESGNLTALYDVLVQGHKWNAKDKTLFKNPYSQFFKIETDLTKTWTLSTRSQLVGHLNYGLLWSYGNSSSAPFSESFYVGGANSIRAFPVRSIGPGSFEGIPDDRQASYVMQNGDVKLVMNLELRHRLFGNLYGALFLDAGNVWSSEDWSLDPDDDEYERDFVEEWNAYFRGWKFHANDFLEQLALGTGVGLRYDLDFLVLRVDWGFGLHLPYKTSRNGYFNISRFKDMHTLHIAIGYPF